MPESHCTVDLAAYFERIGYAGASGPSRATLDALHLAHATHVPFENLDILLGRPIRLDLESLQAKLVRDRRGGYCFEQNRLFAAALEALGFAVTTLAARVRFGASSVRPRTHMLLQVDVDGSRLLADVGFGVFGLLMPVPLDDRGESRQFAWTYRVAREAGLYVLQLRSGSAWTDLYAFTLEPQYPADYEMANHYTSTHPTSHFVQAPIAQRSAPEVRRTLRDRTYTEHRGEMASERTLADDDEVLAVLADRFELHFPPGTRFRARGAG
jgi:N-hydroxyarylamine O-acetyltransferase